MDHLLRPAVEGDASFVVDTWLRSFRPCAWAQRMPGDVYFSRYGHVGFVEDMVVGGHAQVVVACLPTDPDFIYGWSAWSGNILHYVYVKEDYRRQGLGKALLNGVSGLPIVDITVTHATVPWRRFAAKHGINWQWKHPYREEKR